jgi:hypothetical protein
MKYEARISFEWAIYWGNNPLPDGVFGIGLVKVGKWDVGALLHDTENNLWYIGLNGSMRRICTVNAVAAYDRAVLRTG